MKILGIDCSTRWTNIGVAVDGKIAGEFNMAIGRNQSAELPALVENILQRTGLALDSIGAVAVTSGPGYFTGIRVGLSYGCALAEGLGKKVVVLGSLLALAAPFLSGDRPLIPVIRARKGYVYSSVLSGYISSVFPVLPSGLRSVGELTQSINEYGSALVILDQDKDLLEDLRDIEFLNIARNSIRGGHVALLGHYLCDQAVSPTEATGFYLREPDIGKIKSTE